MLSLACDYGEGAHPEILKRLVETNMEHLPGYGVDPYCESAKNKIKEACGCPEAEIYFLVGGTQTNATVIHGILRNYEGVVAVETGHINVHEAGAIEHSGHKVLTIPQHNGKMDSAELKKFLEEFYGDESREHMVFPGMVYISHPTEYGTLYTKEELRKLSEVCKTFQIPLYMDGARLGYGLMSEESDVTLKDIAQCCDVFYIGGTKVGALCGEAVVFTENNAPKNFMTTVKQQGALLAKGRVLGIQFDTLFTDELYMKISRHGIEMAKLLKEGLRDKNYQFYLESPTNQQFIVLQNEKMKKLEKQVDFTVWEKYDEDHTVVRFATSWATKKEDIEKLMELL